MFDVFMFRVVVVLHITVFASRHRLWTDETTDLIVDFDFFNKPRHQFTNHGREGKWTKKKSLKVRETSLSR